MNLYKIKYLDGYGGFIKQDTDYYIALPDEDVDTFLHDEWVRTKHDTYLESTDGSNFTLKAVAKAKVGANEYPVFITHTTKESTRGQVH